MELDDILYHKKLKIVAQVMKQAMTNVMVLVSKCELTYQSQILEFSRIR